jgi:hypothetical protein
MSGMVSKSQIPVRHRASLPGDVQIAIGNLKNAIERGDRLTVYENHKPFSGPPSAKVPDHDGERRPGPSPLPRLDNGCLYYEFDVGAGRQNRGNRRLVAEIVTASRQIRSLYFTDDHYTKGSFVRLL